MPAMWPAELSTNRIGQASSPSVAYDDFHGVMWSSLAAST